MDSREYEASHARWLEIQRLKAVVERWRFAATVLGVLLAGTWLLIALP